MSPPHIPVGEMDPKTFDYCLCLAGWPTNLYMGEAAITGSLSRGMFRGSVLPKWNFPALLKVALSQKMQSHVEFGTSSENQCKTNILFTTRSANTKRLLKPVQILRKMTDTIPCSRQMVYMPCHLRQA